MKKIIVLMLVLMMTFTVNTYANSLMTDITGGASSFLVSPPVNAQADLATTIKNITNIGLVIGTIVAIAAGIIIAIKFMTDSADGKADMKQALTPYIIGVAILFGAYAIWTIVIYIFDIIVF